MKRNGKGEIAVPWEEFGSLHLSIPRVLEDSQRPEWGAKISKKIIQGPHKFFVYLQLVSLLYLIMLCGKFLLTYKQKEK